MSFTLSQQSGVPFYRQVAHHIADQIRTGTLAPGAPLPSVRQLAADLLVSVITVTKAYEELEHQGLVTGQQGRGTFVAPGARGASKAELKREVGDALAAAFARAHAVGLSREEVQSLANAAFTAHFPEPE
ncbi:GntR family transcriptional regulator [Deltaproteobacteria bacterium]|nr:GntR family transcriptional regulator [Deltaproteobacteria bacterium]